MILRMLNGLGGPADSLRSAKISIMCTLCQAPDRRKSTPLLVYRVSWIVPMYTHVNQSSTISTLLSQNTHETLTFRSKDGPARQCCLADVRGLSPRKRARMTVEKRAHPHYHPIPGNYFETAKSKCLKKRWGHKTASLVAGFRDASGL